MKQQTLSKKEKNMLKAARLRYIDNLTNEQIGKQIGASKNTVDNYFASDEMRKFQQYFSENEKQFLKVQLKEKVEDTSEASIDLIGRAINHEDIKPRDYLKAAKERRQTLKDHINMMEALGFDTGEVSEQDKDDSQDMRKKLAEIYNNKQEKDEEEKDNESDKVEQVAE